MMGRSRSLLCFLILPMLFFGVLLGTPISSAQEEGKGLLSVSPGEFTVSDVPPGQPFTLPRDLIVWNRDNQERPVLVSVEIPPENAVRPGYEPIPQENWIIPFPTSVMIPENSYAEIYIKFDIPAWENLTSQKWEVWIRARREPLPGEIGLETISRMKIETSGEVQTEEGEEGFPVLLAVGIAVAVAASVAGAWVLYMRRGIRRHRRR